MCFVNSAYYRKMIRTDAVELTANTFMSFSVVNAVYCFCNSVHECEFHIV